MTIGELFEEYRKSARLTAPEAAATIGMSRENYYRIVKNGAGVRLETALMACRRLQIPITELAKVGTDLGPAPAPTLSSLPPGRMA